MLSQGKHDPTVFSKEGNNESDKSDDSRLTNAILDAATVSEDYFCLLADTQKLLALTHPEKLQEISKEELDTGIRQIQLDSHLVVDKLANWDKLSYQNGSQRPWQSSPKVDVIGPAERFRSRPPPRKSRISYRLKPAKPHPWLRHFPSHGNSPRRRGRKSPRKRRLKHRGEDASATNAIKISPAKHPARTNTLPRRREKITTEKAYLRARKTILAAAIEADDMQLHDDLALFLNTDTEKRQIDWSLEEFLDILMNLEVNLCAEDILAVYLVLQLDVHGHVLRNRPATPSWSSKTSSNMRQFYRLQNASKRVRMEHARHARDLIHQHKVCLLEAKKRRGDRFRLELLNGEIQALEDDGYAEKCFQKALRKSRELFKVRSPADLRRLFAAYDVDGNGEISRDEFVGVMSSMDAGLTHDELVSCFSVLDPQGKDSVSFADFAYAWFNNRLISRRRAFTGEKSNKEGSKEHKMEMLNTLAASRKEISKKYRKVAESIRKTGEESRRRHFHAVMDAIHKEARKWQQRDGSNGGGKPGAINLKAVFKQFDKDGNNSISRAEFASACRSGFRMELSSEDLDACFHHLDPNGDGDIDFGEFAFAFFNRRRNII